MAAKSGVKVIFVKSRQYTLNSLWVENFDEIAISRTVKEIEAISCFCIFGKNSKFKMATIFGERKFFLKTATNSLPRYHLGPKCFDKIALSRMVKEIEQISVFAFLAKIQNGRHFWG